MKKFLRLSIFSFLFTSTFSWINFFIWNENSYFSWNFSKFSSIVFNLSDLFLFLSIFLFLVFLYQNYSWNQKFLKLKILNLFFWNKKININNPGTLFNFLFFWLVLSSIFTSFFIENFSNFLLHFSILIKFFSAGFLIFYLPENIFSKKEILNTLIFSFVIQSFIAFLQVVFQSPVWLFFLWENNFSENILWLAKISLSNWENFIRWYWTLAHPNILWLWSLILYFLARKSWFKFLKNILIIWIFFSFSKTAIIWFFILKIYENFFLWEKNFFQLEKFFTDKIKIFYTIFYSSIFIWIFLFFWEKILTRFQNFFWTWFQERILQLEISKNILIENFNLVWNSFFENFSHILWWFFWLGFWNFTLKMQDFTTQILKPREFQPVHNFFILFWTEVWILWLWILLFFIWHIFLNSKKFFLEKFFLILILFFWSFFDHFLLTSSIWIILFWIILRKIS